MKAMSIVGIVWFSVCFVFVVYGFGKSEPDYEGSASFGFLGLLYALPLSIVTVVNSLKKYRPVNHDVVSELTKLGELKEKGILTEEEFANCKSKVLDYD